MSAARRTRRWAVKPEGGLHYAYARLTDAEYAIVRRLADRDGLSVSDYVRRCINSVLIEEGDDVPLLAEKRSDLAKERELDRQP